MDQPGFGIGSADSFDFALSPAGLVSVTHRGERLRWDFIVETANGRRFLQPIKNRMNAVDRRLTASLRREAFAFAVAQARRQDMID